MIMVLLNCDEKYINGMASDFEYFDEWERVTELAAGHDEVRKYHSELEALGLSFPKEGYSRERSIVRWKKANRALGCLYFESDQWVSVGEVYAHKPDDTSDETCYDVVNNMSKFITSCHNIESLINELSKDISSIKNPNITLRLDIVCEKYLRPDPYGAAQIYKKKISGEKLNLDQELVLYAQILISLLLHLSERKKITIEIIPALEITPILELVQYLHRRRLFCGEIRIKVSCMSDLGSLAETAKKVYPRIWVRPLISDKNNLKDPLSQMFSVYPEGAFRILP